jgi:hypothetical protein
MAQPYNPSVSEQSSSWTEQARDLGRQAVDQTVEATTTARDIVKENPTATLAAIAGVAFIIGALWMVGRSRYARPTLLDRLADLQAELPRRWRT